MFKLEKRFVLYFAIILFILLLDQGAKALVLSRLEYGQSWDFIPAISGFLRVTRSLNTGAAFGIFPSGSTFLLSIGFVTIAVFTYLFYDMPAEAKLTIIGIAIVLGGAISNIIDRIRFGYVVDYVHVQLGPNFANISNFADHAVTIGVIFLLIDQWILAEREAEKADETAEGVVDN